MTYTKLTLTDGTILKAEHLNHIEDGIVGNEEAIASANTLANNSVNIASNALTTAEAANTNATTANTTASEAYNLAEEANQTAQGKQNALESGVNIKTINGESILGEGNITIEADVDLDSKQDKLVSGTNIKTINGESILGSGNITIEVGSEITVDSELSTESTNPVQNKVITNAINSKQDALVSGLSIRTINGQSLLGDGDIVISDQDSTETAADVIESLLAEDSDTYDLSENIRAMVQPTCIDYDNAGTVGNVVTPKSSSTSVNAIAKCGFGHFWFMCNRDFTFTMSTYKFCVIGLNDDMTLALNSGYVQSYTVKKYDPNDSTTFPWFSLIIYSGANSTSIQDKLDTVANCFNFIVSKEDIDNDSDFPLVLGLTTFLSDGTLGIGADFSTYGSDSTAYRNTLSLAYPIIGEEQIEQTVKTTGWYQGLTAYNEAGVRSHIPGRYPTMTWVETLKDEKLFVYWSKTSDNEGISTSVITYEEAETLANYISIKKRSANNPTDWVMGLNDDVRAYSHRIEAELSPKNSIHALEYGYNRGFRWFEMDIRLTSDNVAVSSHDATYMGMTIPTSTYAELSTGDFGATHSPKFAGVRMLKLEDALIFCSKMGCGLNIELKPMGGDYAWTKEKVQAVYDLITKYGMTNRVVWNQNIYSGTETTNVLGWLIEIDPTAGLILLNSSMTESLIATAKTYLTGSNIVEVYAPASTITQTLVDSAIANGLKVGTHWVSTTDTITPTSYKTFKDMGITSIITESGNPTFYEYLLNA